MRWTVKDPLDEYEWHAWYAWYPVRRTKSLEYVWFEWIERRLYDSIASSGWEYRNKGG